MGGKERKGGQDRRTEAERPSLESDPDLEDVGVGHVFRVVLNDAVDYALPATRSLSD